MTESPRPPSSDIAFTSAVKAMQAQKGSRRSYAAMEARGGFQTLIDEGLSAFIAEQRSVFLATANAAGQPYIQHRGGPPGFLRVLDEHTLAFADYRGNRQYISMGNGKSQGAPISDRLRATGPRENLGRGRGDHR